MELPNLLELSDPAHDLLESLEGYDPLDVFAAVAAYVQTLAVQAVEDGMADCDALDCELTKLARRITRAANFCE